VRHLSQRAVSVAPTVLELDADTDGDSDDPF